MLNIGPSWDQNKLNSFGRRNYMLKFIDQYLKDCNWSSLKGIHARMYLLKL